VQAVRRQAGRSRSASALHVPCPHSASAQPLIALLSAVPCPCPPPPLPPLQKDEFLRLVINSVRNDLISRNEAFQCLSLDFIANGGWREGGRVSVSVGCLFEAVLMVLRLLV
jgi:hypothetical protein